MSDLINMAPLPIMMTDHEDSPVKSDTPIPTVWCKNCTIGEPTIVSGNFGFGFGWDRYVVYTVKLETTRGTKIVLRKRFSEFVALREELLKVQQNIPKLPVKTVGKQFDNSFLEQRRRGLEFFLTTVLLDPSLSKSEPVKAFVLNSRN